MKIEFRTDPARYRHWSIDVRGEVATLTMHVDEGGGLVEGYELKLNSYDLGVDIELYDAVQRLRFEHPEVRAVVITSGRDRIFSAGANIRMLAASDHVWKVNFCKFTNETRMGIEDATVHSGQTYVAALNGTASGGGYELALACDHIMLVDDRSSVVSFPELPLLGVLPGTGGLTRLVDKRGVRRDLADFFATRPEGVGGGRAVEWRLVDEVVVRTAWTDTVAARATELAARSDRPRGAKGLPLPPLRKTRSEDAVAYDHVSAALDRERGTAEITIRGPDGPPPPEIRDAGFWTLAFTRELDDLILDLRTNEVELGTWIIRTTGDPEHVLAHDRFLLERCRSRPPSADSLGESDVSAGPVGQQTVSIGTPLHRQTPESSSVSPARPVSTAAHTRGGMTQGPAEVAASTTNNGHRDAWLANEIVHYLKRTLKRLDVTSRSIVALIEPGSCFAGSLLELALAADRSYHLIGTFTDEPSSSYSPAAALPTPTPTPTLASTPMPASTPTPVSTATPASRPTPTSTDAPALAPTSTLVPTSARSLTSAPTGTHSPTSGAPLTHSLTPSPTVTHSPTSTLSPATVTVDAMNFGPLTMANGLSRLQTRYFADGAGLAAVRDLAGKPLVAEEAVRLGLVTFAPDDLDWEEEVRLAIEERGGFSPDALTGLEANCRFPGPETLETKIFGRLAAWQNWIFTRPNASGPEGALRRYGTGRRPDFDRKRV